MTREEAIERIGEQYKVCKEFYHLSANPEKDYPGVMSYMEALDLSLTALRPVSREQVETGYFKASGDLELCRCPFCGSEDVVYERYLHVAGYRWRVVCTSCMASIDPGHAQQRSTVQRMWNTRAPILSEIELKKLEETT